MSRKPDENAPVADYAVWRSGTDPEKATLVPATSAFDARKHMAKTWRISVTEVLARRYR